MLSKRFPFGIYYELEDDVGYVYAIPGFAARSALDSEAVAEEKVDAVRKRPTSN